MKNLVRTFAAAIAALGVAAGLFSCDRSSENARISFDSYSASTTYSLVGSASRLDLPSDIICRDSVSLVLPITFNQTDVTPLRNAILNEALGQSATSVENAMHDWLDAKQAESGFKTASVPYQAGDNAMAYNIVRGFVVYMSPQFLIYCVNHESMAPEAANAMSTRRYINYLLQDNGKILTLDDLFTAEGQTLLPGLIAQQAEKNIEYAGNVDIISLPASGNFYISSEGEIVFSYDPMEVGPHSLGNVEIGFYPAELVGEMTPAAVKLFGLEDLVEN